MVGVLPAKVPSKVIARASEIFLRPIVDMLVVAGTFLALDGWIGDPGVRGAVAWTAGPLVIEVARAVLRRRRAQRTAEEARPEEAPRRDGEGLGEAQPPDPRR